MPLDVDQHLIVFTTNTVTPRWLSHWTEMNGWELPLPLCSRALPRVLLESPRCVIVHLNPVRDPDPALHLIRTVHELRPQIIQVATSERNCETLERAVRSAGATMFVLARSAAELDHELVSLRLAAPRTASRQRSPPQPMSTLPRERDRAPPLSRPRRRHPH